MNANLATEFKTAAVLAYNYHDKGKAISAMIKSARMYYPKRNKNAIAKIRTLSAIRVIRELRSGLPEC